MGNLLCGLKQYMFPRKSVKILMIGLDATGKTSILYQLKLGEVVTTIPTIGFNVETVTHQNVDFVMWDLGSRDKIRPLWKHYFKNIQAIIFVIDSNDHQRLEEAKDELWNVLKSPELPSSVRILIMANKQDLPTSLSTDEITKRLELTSVSSHCWHVCGSSVITGEGLYEGLEWLHSSLTEKFVKDFVNKPIKETTTILLSNEK